jgi:hypothetical protein
MYLIEKTIKILNPKEHLNCFGNYKVGRKGGENVPSDRRLAGKITETSTMSPRRLIYEGCQGMSLSPYSSYLGCCCQPCGNNH